jgi:hypothetical protein
MEERLMYDFYFGSKEEIESDPKKWLLAIKRMLPRWCNSIPDSEFLAILDVLVKYHANEAPVLVETGSGASTIVLLYFAMKNNGELYTWDISGTKLAFIRGVLNDTVMRYFDDKNLNKYWKYTAYDSTSKYAGISILKELSKRATGCFLDSEHTLDVLMKEVKMIQEIAIDEPVFAIDDGNYNYKYYNAAYINMIRKKHDLPLIDSSSDNIGEKFYKAVGDFLSKKYARLEHIKDSYKENYSSDIYWSYYQLDREVMKGLDMEKKNELYHRFDAWKAYKLVDR